MRPDPADSPPVGSGGEVRPHHTPALNLLLSLATCVVGLGGAEGICRFLERRQPPHEVAPYITPWREEEGGFYTVESAAAGWPPWEDYNSEGLRDREHAVERAQGVRRVVCLGDSTTLGWGILPAEAYPQVLGELLESVGERAEVFNVALGGWSTRQERIAYERIARKYRPDSVLLAICLNDIPELQNNLSRPPASLVSLYRASALVRRLVGAREREIADVEELFSAGDSARVQQAYRLLFGEIRALRDETRADGASFAVLVFPFRLQVLPGAPEPSPQRTIGEFCRAEGIPFVDVLPALLEAGADAYIDYDHFSPRGARIVAERVLGSGLVDPASPASFTPLDAERGAAEAARHASRGPTLPRLLLDLEAANPHQRAAAARGIGNLGPAAAPAVPRLVRRLEDPEPPVRAGAAWALGQVGPGAKAALPRLVPLLYDGDPGVRFRAGESLGEIVPDTEAARSALIAVVGDLNAPGRGEAAAALGGLGPAAEGALPALIQALDDPREGVRGRSAWAIGQIGPAARSAVPALLVAFEDPRIRWRVADALGALGKDALSAAPELVDALGDPNSSVRWRAAQALGEIGPAASRIAVPALLKAVRDPFDNVRLGALVALDNMGANSTAARLAYLRALNDEDARVRARAAKALRRPRPPGDDARARSRASNPS
jgi:HEAT repeat protein/lysophospholipase L1-like esterase